jgi:hypothetical protein
MACPVRTHSASKAAAFALTRTLWPSLSRSDTCVIAVLPVLRLLRRSMAMAITASFCASRVEKASIRCRGESTLETTTAADAGPEDLPLLRKLSPSKRKDLLRDHYFRPDRAKGGQARLLCVASRQPRNAGPGFNRSTALRGDCLYCRPRVRGPREDMTKLLLATRGRSSPYRTSLA